MAHELTYDEAIADYLRTAKRIAVLGIKTENQSSQPAFYVADYLKKAGYEIVPVPVYYPEVTTILSMAVHRSIASISGEIDIVDVFRRPQDIEAHLADIISKKPKLVWFQLGIRNDDAARRLIEAGIDVIQDRCMLAEHRRLIDRSV